MRRIYELEKKLADFVEASSGNYISEDRAARKELAGMKIYESPLVGAADISDPEFEKLSSASAIGPHFTHPKKWLKDGKTVLSFFFRIQKR